MPFKSKIVEKNLPLFFKLKSNEIKKIFDKQKNKMFLYHKDNDNVLFKEYHKYNDNLKKHEKFNEITFKIFNNHFDFDIEGTIDKIIKENKKYIESYFVEGRFLFYEDYMGIDNIICNIKFKDVLIENLTINLKKNFFTLNFSGNDKDLDLKNKVRMCSDKHDLFFYYLRLLIKKEDSIKEFLFNINENSEIEPILKISNLIQNKDALDLIKILNYD